MRKGKQRMGRRITKTPPANVPNRTRKDVEQARGREREKPFRSPLERLCWNYNHDGMI